MYAQYTTINAEGILEVFIIIRRALKHNALSLIYYIRVFESPECVRMFIRNHNIVCIFSVFFFSIFARGEIFIGIAALNIFCMVYLWSPFMSVFICSHFLLLWRYDFLYVSAKTFSVRNKINGSRALGSYVELIGIKLCISIIYLPWLTSMGSRSGGVCLPCFSVQKAFGALCHVATHCTYWQ